MELNEQGDPMVRGLIVPLSPNEEIALRRVAYGSADVAFRYAERLMRLALVEDAADGLRLTSVGQQRIGLLTIGLSGDAVGAEQHRPHKPSIPAPPSRPIYVDRREWMEQARLRLCRIREGLAIHRKRQDRLMARSFERIEDSQLRLRSATTRSPVNPR
ncbi:MAG TPA: hypothetical protein VF991_02145 [Reyranella sp.]